MKKLYLGLGLLDTIVVIIDANTFVWYTLPDWDAVVNWDTLGT